jgi:integrase
VSPWRAETTTSRTPTAKPTARNLLSLPPGDYTDSVVEGLTLRVRSTGRRWAVRYRPKRGAGRGPQRRLHFGEVSGPVTLDLAALDLGAFTAPPALTLEGARAVARALLGLAAKGQDPMAVLEAADRARSDREAEAARRRIHGTATLGALLDRFLDARAVELRPATVANWRGLARTVLAPLRDRDPATVTASEVRRFHKSIGADGRRVTANRALELLSVLYAWAMKTEDDRGEPLLGATPCASVDPFPEEVRTRVLDSNEVKAVWDALNGEVYADAFRLLLWTGARKTEALGAEWREVDFKARLWRIPPSRSKTGMPRPIPLSSAALAMLTARREADARGQWVFASPVRAAGPVHSIAAPLARVQKRSGTADWTVHDLRRTVRTGLSALGVAVPVAEFIMGHLAPRMVRAYDQHQPLAEAASALEAWARRLDSFVSATEGAADVLPWRR